MNRLKAELIWAWSWFCWLVLMIAPVGFASTRIGRMLGPWAGLYAYTDRAVYLDGDWVHHAPRIPTP